jgi:hypothetical protein
MVMRVWTDVTEQAFWHGHASALRLARRQVEDLCRRARPTNGDRDVTGQAPKEKNPIR